MKKPTIQEAIYLLVGLLVAVLAVWVWSVKSVNNGYLNAILENGYVMGQIDTTRAARYEILKNAKQMECTTSTTGSWWLQVQ